MKHCVLLHLGIKLAALRKNNAFEHIVIIFIIPFPYQFKSDVKPMILAIVQQLIKDITRCNALKSNNQSHGACNGELTCHLCL